MTNVDEAGNGGRLDDLQPQAGEPVSRLLRMYRDEDGRHCEQTSVAVVEVDGSGCVGRHSLGPTSPTYTPEIWRHAGYYLRATATYSDGLGYWARHCQCYDSVFAVEERPVANAQPSFEVQADDWG